MKYLYSFIEWLHVKRGFVYLTAPVARMTTLRDMYNRSRSRVL